jgi:hypothetical protein
MPKFSFTTTEFDRERPWIMLRRERRTVELDDGVDCYGWARVRWPEPCWRVDLDPWEQSPERHA